MPKKSGRKRGGGRNSPLSRSARSRSQSTSSLDALGYSAPSRYRSTNAAFFEVYGEEYQQFIRLTDTLPKFESDDSEFSRADVIASLPGLQYLDDDGQPVCSAVLGMLLHVMCSHLSTQELGEFRLVHEPSIAGASSARLGNIMMYRQVYANVEPVLLLEVKSKEAVGSPPTQLLVEAAAALEEYHSNKVLAGVMYSGWVLDLYEMCHEDTRAVPQRYARFSIIEYACRKLAFNTEQVVKFIQVVTNWSLMNVDLSLAVVADVPRPVQPGDPDVQHDPVQPGDPQPGDPFDRDDPVPVQLAQSQPQSDDTSV